MPLCYIFILILSFVCSASTSKASLIEATFAGTIIGIGPYGGEPAPYTKPFSTTFTASFIFDTALSTITQIAPGAFQLTETGGEASASITLAAITGHPFFGNGPLTYFVSASDATLTWQDALGPTGANVDSGGHFHISAALNDNGAFQHGLCPSSYNPCGVTFATSSAFVDASPVPGPIVGAELPSFLMAIAGFIGWRRSRLVRAIRGNDATK
jgi:hypothetical protein